MASRSYDFPRRCCVCLGEEQTRVQGVHAGSGNGSVVTFTFYVPYCASCDGKRRRAERVRLRAALIMGAVGFAAGGLLKDLGAAAGGAVLGFVLTYFVVEAILNSALSSPAHIDEAGRPRFKNKEYQLLFDRKNPA